MAKKLYVGNLPYTTDDHELTEFFSSFGQVTSARVIFDRETGRSKGFGFVEMTNDDEANAAIEQGNTKQLSGRTLRVSEAKPQEPRGPREGGGGFRSRGPR